MPSFTFPIILFLISGRTIIAVPSKLSPFWEYKEAEMRNPNRKCTRDLDCDSPSMVCNRNDPRDPFCDCGHFHTWSGELHKCVGLVNTSCSLGKDCAKNSFCNDQDWCQCNHTHVPTKNRTCLLHYGSPCDPKLTPGTGRDICNPEQSFVCNWNTNRCDCEFPDQMNYDETLQECRMLFGEPCDVGLGTKGQSTQSQQQQPRRKCVKGAICRTTRLGGKIGKCFPVGNNKVQLNQSGHDQGVPPDAPGNKEKHQWKIDLPGTTTRPATFESDNRVDTASGRESNAPSSFTVSATHNGSFHGHSQTDQVKCQTSSSSVVVFNSMYFAVALGLTRA